MTVEDLRKLLRAIVRDHPSWTKAQVRAEVLRRAQPALPGFLDDSGVNVSPYGSNSAAESA